MHMPLSPINLAVLVSGSGTTLQNLIDQIAQKNLDARIKLVIGSRPGLLALQRAIDANIPQAVVDRREIVGRGPALRAALVLDDPCSHRQLRMIVSHFGHSRSASGTSSSL